MSRCDRVAYVTDVDSIFSPWHNSSVWASRQCRFRGTLSAKQSSWKCAKCANGKCATNFRTCGALLATLHEGAHVAHMASSNCTVDVADVAACTPGVDRMSHNETRKVCPPWGRPSRRGITVRGTSSAAMRELGVRIATATAARPISIAAIGGSVTAGPGGYSWLEHVKDHYFARRRYPFVRFSKLATNGMGPEYMVSCFVRHLQDFGGSLPDVVVAEYAVNDLWSQNNASTVRALAHSLARLRVVLVLLHHFSPIFLLGSPGYKGGITITAEPAHEQAARELGLTSASFKNATGLPSWWARGDPARAVHPCLFTCVFHHDGIHPNACGHRWLGQLTAATLLRVFDAASAAASRPPGRPSSRHGAERASSERAKRAQTAARCWSLVGAARPDDVNLVPADAGGWKKQNLKGRVHPQMATIYKMVFCSEHAPHACVHVCILMRMACAWHVYRSSAASAPGSASSSTTSSARRATCSRSCTSPPTRCPSAGRAWRWTACRSSRSTATSRPSPATARAARSSMPPTS